jgi:NADPH:quinone reductase-like Zn-dependent oxidoreductase
MRAVVSAEYGGPDVLRIADIERPVPADDEVLVEVHTTTVNRTDCGFRAPSPWFIRLVGSKKAMMPIPRYTKDKVLRIKELIEAGAYRAVIDRSYPLEEAADATRYVETEQKTGNVVLIVRSEE